MVLVPTTIAYQDLGALLVHQPGVSQRWREHLIASPFGTIHAATFSMPRPLGTRIPHPPLYALANFDPLPESAKLGERLSHDKAVVAAVFKLVHDLRALPKGATDDQARQVFANVGEQLFALSKCPDYVINRGHYFGSHLSDADKNALIAYLKTF